LQRQPVTQCVGSWSILPSVSRFGFIAEACFAARVLNQKGCGIICRDSEGGFMTQRAKLIWIFGIIACGTLGALIENALALHGDGGVWGFIVGVSGFACLRLWHRESNEALVDQQRSPR